MNPISDMAFYCCGVRMDDARAEHTVCADLYARLFMCEHGQHIHDIFKEEKNSNASILVRHRIIDDFLRKTLTAQPDTCIITIGAGFDTRPYRLHGGYWIELDDAQVLAWKEQRLPMADCPNPLLRIPIDFCTETLEDKLALVKPTSPVVLVVEGVFIYLSEKEIKHAIAAFQNLFPSHQLVCDLVSRDMVESYGKTLHEKIQALGTEFRAVNHPETVFTLHGYGIKEAISIIERGADFGFHSVPKMLLRYLFSGDVMGNAVYVFEPGDPYGDLII